MPQDPDIPPSRPSSLGCLLQALGAARSIAIVCGGALHFDLGIDAHYDHRARTSPGRGRALTLPAATDITLDRHFPIDHEAWFTIEEEDLNAFFDVHYGRGLELDSFSERSPVRRELFEERYGFLDWVWHDGIVSYSFSARNGGGQRYVHDPATGRTYHFSRYW